MSESGWSAAAPILRVLNLDASLEYYMKVLGFKLDWRAGMIASVTRDRCCLFLCAGGPERGTDVDLAGRP